MATPSRIISLFRKDLLLEIRQQYSFYGVVLYVGATIFVLYLALESPESRVWNGLFWVVQLFICINAVAKSFLQEAPGRMLYYQTLVSPLQFVLSKLLFNAVLMLLMSSLCYALFALFLGYPVIRPLPFLGLVLLGGVSLSLVFTFLAAIAARAQQNAAIMAILGFPIIIPQLIMLMKISEAAFSKVGSFPATPIAMLFVMDGLVILLAAILFPYLWKD
ncbi:MAG: cytochrome C biogenesis protein [Chitinophagaceae bacterium]|nr:MAG: cytochrome C biogenesis protein [Chitinophagaceae bacterium]